jgi:hypothetical protein
MIGCIMRCAKGPRLQVTEVCARIVAATLATLRRTSACAARVKKVNDADLSLHAVADNKSRKHSTDDRYLIGRSLAWSAWPLLPINGGGSVPTTPRTNIGNAQSLTGDIRGHLTNLTRQKSFALSG